MMPLGQKVDLDEITDEERTALERARMALRHGSYARNLMRTGSLQLVPGPGADRSLPTIVINRMNVAILGDADPVAFCLAIIEAPSATREEVALVTEALHCLIAAAAVETGTSDVRFLSAHCPTGAAEARMRRRIPTPDMRMQDVETDPALLAMLPPFARIGVIIPDEDAEGEEAVTTVVISPLTSGILKEGPLPDAVEILRALEALKSLASGDACSRIGRT